jgi:4-carboxymuconolactone decarboxylase
VTKSGRGEDAARWHDDAATVRSRLHPQHATSDLSENAMAALSPEFAAVLGDWALSRYVGSTLDLRTRALCTVAALVALGESRYTQNWIGNALNAGATRDEIVALLEQLAAYVGVPKSVAAFAAARAAFDDEPRRSLDC